MCMLGLAGTSSALTSLSFNEEAVPPAQTELDGTTYFSSYGISFEDFVAWTIDPDCREDDMGVYNNRNNLLTI